MTQPTRQKAERRKLYRIISGWNIERAVETAISEGWTLHGGVSVAYSPGGSVLHSQALTMETTA